jgi:hypothetical protein
VVRDLARDSVASGSGCVIRISGYPSEIISKHTLNGFSTPYHIILFQEMTRQYSQVRPGRVFVLLLQDGEFVHEVIERLALEQHIEAVSLRSGSENLN